MKLGPFLLAMFMLVFNVTQAWAQDLETDLLEVETAMADSEAAQDEAVQTQRRLKMEQKQSEKAMKEAAREIDKARRVERKAKNEIALREKQIINVQDDTEKAKNAIEEARLKQDKLKLEIEKVNEDLDRSKRTRDEYLSKKESVMSDLKKVKDSVAKINRKMNSIKSSEKKAYKELTRAEMELKTVRKKAVLAAKKSKGQSKEYMKVIGKHRKSLKKISRRLDEMEVEMDVEIAYSEKKERKKMAIKRTRTLASLNTGKFAKVTTPACNIRNFPTTNSKVVGTYRKGRKIHVKLHDGSWYSTVFKGEKVFMGAGCFN